MPADEAHILVRLPAAINDRAIVGYDALLKQQREWWQDGGTDVVYTVVGEPEFRMPAPGLVMTTYFLTSRRTRSDGTARNTRFGITALWQRRAEGWRIIHAHESTVNPQARRSTRAGRRARTDGGDRLPVAPRDDPGLDIAAQ